MDLSKYKSLSKRHKEQSLSEVFAHFPGERDHLTGKFDYDAPFTKLAAKTLEDATAWDFTQARFQSKYPACPKLRNYLAYTFVRLKELEHGEPGEYFVTSEDDVWCAFNTGLQDKHSADLYAVFQRYQPPVHDMAAKAVADWVYKGAVTSREFVYRNHIALRLPALAWFSMDSRDFIFDTGYTIDTDVFDHMFDRARERSGFPELRPMKQ